MNASKCAGFGAFCGVFRRDLSAFGGVESACVLQKRTWCKSYFA